MSSSRIGVSIVAYRPEAQALNLLLEALAPRHGEIVVVDNGGAAAVISSGLRDRIVLIEPGENVGVAAGHNLAIAQIFAKGCSHALLFDQDSLPLEGMIDQLLQEEQALLSAGHAVAAIGPIHQSAVDGEPSGFVRFSGCRPQVIRHADADLPGASCRCDFLITSGTLLRREVFDIVGPFDESLFIDNVDVEWCYRAASYGLYCHGAVKARMRHALGDRAIRIPFSRRQLVIHSPMRIYFITRNRWLLYWLPHVSLGWKLADFPRMLIKLMAFMLFVPPRSRYLKAGFAGLRDGIRRKGGAARASY